MLLLLLLLGSERVRLAAIGFVTLDVMRRVPIVVTPDRIHELAVVLERRQIHQFPLGE